jgi:hypothetical protein
LLNGDLFLLHLRAKANSSLQSALKTSTQRIAPEAYISEKEERAALALQFAAPKSKVLTQALQIAPNPSTGAFGIQNPFSGTYTTLRILDLWGNLVFAQEGNLPATISIRGDSKWGAGFYFVTLNNGLESRTGKILITD